MNVVYSINIKVGFVGLLGERISFDKSSKLLEASMFCFKINNNNMTEKIIRRSRLIRKSVRWKLITHLIILWCVIHIFLGG